MYKSPPSHYSTGYSIYPVQYPAILCLLRRHVQYIGTGGGIFDTLSATPAIPSSHGEPDKTVVYHRVFTIPPRTSTVQ